MYVLNLVEGTSSQHPPHVYRIRGTVNGKFAINKWENYNDSGHWAMCVCVC